MDGDVGFSRHQADIATAKSAVIASIQQWCQILIRCGCLTACRPQ